MGAVLIGALGSSTAWRPNIARLVPGVFQQESDNAMRRNSCRGEVSHRRTVISVSPKILIESRSSEGINIGLPSDAL